MSVLHHGGVPFGRMPKRYKAVITAAVLIIAVIAFVVADYRDFAERKQAMDEISERFSVHYIDVGQGDATLMRSPSGKFMLIDSSPTANSNILVKYLLNAGVEKLDYIIVTHPHDDHYGGVTELMEYFDVGELILHKDFSETYPYNRFIDMAKELGIGVRLTEKGERFVFDECAEFEILSPAYTDKDDLNESSLCFRVVYGDTAFMFTGDAGRDSEYRMLSSGKPLEADILKAGHHGSSTSNVRSFVKAVNPEYAVVSCEENNDYGHPHREVVKLFNDMGIEMLVTHETGGAVFISDGETVVYAEDFFENEDKEENTFLKYIKSRLRLV